MKTKYITFNNHYGEPDIVVFSGFQKHSDVAQDFNLTKSEVQFEPMTIIGAGFISFNATDTEHVLVECYGKSDSLGVACHPGDDALANRLLVDPQ